jgi:putative ABC transport system permease protein
MSARGALVARRAVFRWAWRLFRREWRQQLLIVSLITVAVAATIVGSAVAVNTPPASNAGFGTASDMATYLGGDPHLSAQVASLQRRFGAVDVIEDETLAVPGSVATYQLQAQDPHGPFGGPMLSLVSGRDPSTAGEIALSSVLASDLGLSIGGTFRAGGVTRRVVGIVENPQSLLDAFALVVPGQVISPSAVTVLFDAPGVPASSIGPQVTTAAAAANTNPLNPETLSFAVLTIGMILIALMSIGGFTVLAQRRLRSLGMLAAIGATDRNVSLVVRANGLVVGAIGALLGTAAGLLLWLAYRPHLEQSVHHLIGVFALPWNVLAAAIVLALLATYLAARRPARAITRLPVMAALSGRPAPPKKVHRSALPGLVFLVIAFVLLGLAGGVGAGSGSKGTFALVLGIVALIPAVILLAPFFLAGLGRVARRAPVGVRLALRDLSRYRARSSSALAAVSIGVMIAVIIAVLAQVRYSDVWDPAGPNLASNQVLVSGGLQSYTPAQLATATRQVDRVGAAMGAQHVVTLYNSSVGLQNESGTKYFNPSIYVATPQLLAALGIPASAIRPDADIVTSMPGLTGGGVQMNWCDHLVPQGPPGSGNVTCTQNGALDDPVIQGLPSLPTGVHAPNTLVTEYAIHKYGLESQLTGGIWLLEGAQPFTAEQLHAGLPVAAAAGDSIESKNDEPTSATVVDWATVFGMLLALCILAMSVGLIRSESAGDLRTLTATGAGATTRRTLTAATAGALGLVGAVLGTFAGYVGVIGWLRGNTVRGGFSALGNVPVANMLVLLLGLPVAAAVIGWLLAGREPQVISRQPME